MTPVLFATFPLNFDNADPQNPVPIDPPNPKEPAAPAEGAGGGTVAIYKKTAANYQEYRRKANHLRLAAIPSLGPALGHDITDPLTGAIMLTLPEIMQHHHNLFGVRTANDIRAMKERLREPILGQDMQLLLIFAPNFKTR